MMSFYCKLDSTDQIFVSDASMVLKHAVQLCCVNMICNELMTVITNKL